MNLKSLIKSTVAICFPPYKTAQKRLAAKEQQVCALRKERDALQQKLKRYDGETFLKQTCGSEFFPPEGEVCHDYYIEITSNCNLHCRLCAHGHREMFYRNNGTMGLALFEEILEKIKQESPSARVLPYQYCEPLLNPNLSEFVKAIKRRGFQTSIASNFNYVRDIHEFVASGADELVVGLSGFTNDIYTRAHAGGDINKVKANLIALREEIDRQSSSMQVSIFYHMYKYNLGQDFDDMKSFVQDLGFSFGKNWARSIMLELTILHLMRQHGESSGLEWFDNLPAIPEKFMESYKELAYLPEVSGQVDIDLRECPYNKCFTHIKSDGSVNLCPCAFDDRLIAHKNFLEATPSMIGECRKKHPLCKKCLQYKFYIYMCYADLDRINAFSKNFIDKDTPNDRIM